MKADDLFITEQNNEEIESILSTIDDLLTLGGMDEISADVRLQEQRPRKEIDLEELRKQGYQEAQLNEIAIGQEKGIAVELYAKKCFNWKQMREIRLGLMEKLNTEIYEEPLYSWEQMHEIRLGLVDHIDVTSYARLMYSGMDMRTKRLELLTEAYNNGNRHGYAREIVDEDAGLEVRFSDNYMAAYAKLSEKGRGKYSAADIIKLLEQREVVYGYLRSNVERLISENYDGEEIKIAEGLKESVGKDGYYEFLFNEMLPEPPKEGKDGKVDYRQVRVADTVEPGQTLAVYHHACAGKMGRTVNGISIDGLDGKNLPVLSGKNIKIDLESNRYISTVRGFATYNNYSYELNVHQVYVVNGDINRYNGNLEYDGTIYVKGAVLEMATIKAKGDIIIDGFVEGANLYAGQNIMIRCGINGGGKGIVSAGGRIMAEFFESATLRAKGTIEGSYFLNCDIESDYKVIARGSRSGIIGGSVIAAIGIESGRLGNMGKKKAVFDVGNVAAMDRKIALLEQKLEGVEDELTKLNEGRHKLRQMFGNNVEANSIFQRTCIAINQKEAESEEIEKEVERLRRIREQAVFAYVRVTLEVQEDVHIIINGKRKAFRERSRGVLLTRRNMGEKKQE